MTSSDYISGKKIWVPKAFYFFDPNLSTAGTLFILNIFLISTALLSLQNIFTFGQTTQKVIFFCKRSLEHRNKCTFKCIIFNRGLLFPKIFFMHKQIQNEETHTCNENESIRWWWRKNVFLFVSLHATCRGCNFMYTATTTYLAE